MPPSHISATRGFAKGFIPALSTNAKKHTSTPPPPNASHAHAILRHSARTPPPAPRLRTVPLPNVEPKNDSFGDIFKASILSPTVRPQQIAPKALNGLIAYEDTPRSISYDISMPPSSLRLPSQLLLEPALVPLSTVMHITCDGLPWPIEVFSTSGSTLSCLTVLCGIYVSLQRTVSELEWAVTPPAMQRVAVDSFLQRCRAAPQNTGQQLKRLDFLSGRTLFKGISPLDGLERWVIHLEAR